MLDRKKKESPGNQQEARKDDATSALLEILAAGNEKATSARQEEAGNISEGSRNSKMSDISRPGKRTRPESHRRRRSSKKQAAAAATTGASINSALKGPSAGDDSAKVTLKISSTTPIDGATRNSTRRSNRTRSAAQHTGAAASASTLCTRTHDIADSDTRQLRPRKRVKYDESEPTKPVARTTSTGMSLRKRASIPLQKPSAAGLIANNAYNEHRRSIDTGECEVCLHPYALTYLSKHRNKVHGLAHTVQGCPYCSDIFNTPQERLKHIQTTHKGKPAHWSVEGCDNLDNVKVHMYPCPLCPAHFTHSGLACHLGMSHLTSIDAFDIYCKCPFCMSSPDNGKQLSTFRSEQDLREHVAKRHKGCYLLDDIKPPPDRVFTRPASKSVPPQLKKPPPRPQGPRPQETFNEESEEYLSEAEEGDASEEEHWERLDHSGLISDYVYGNYAPVDFGTGTPSLSIAIKAVESQLKILEETKDMTDDNYVAEMKLYNKGLKDRKQKADAERIEKERHREEVKNKLMEIEYKNRNKKRSAEDIEYAEFLKRPISFRSAARESERKTASCALGKDCELCYCHDEEPETDFAGQLIDAPSCHTNVVGDSLKAVSRSLVDDEDETKRGRRRRVDSTTRSVLMLRELKQSLHFVAGYNAGYFSQKEAK